MNENPGGMPNPLNPTPGASPEPSANPLDANPADSTPLEEIVEEVQTISVAPETNTAGAVDPMARPMEQAPVVTAEPPKKKKTGLIIGIIIAVIVLIGGGVAAALILINMNSDPVAKAVEKVMSGKMPANIGVNGAITIEPGEENTPIENFQIGIKSEASTSSSLNSTSATITANFTDGEIAEMSFDEIYAANGDLYLKFDNVTGALEDYMTALQNAASSNPSSAVTDCLEDENGDTVCSEDALESENLVSVEDGEVLSEEVGVDETALTNNTDLFDAFSGIFEIVETAEGEWLRVSVDEINEMATNMTTDESTTCLVNLISGSNSYNNSIAEAYNKTPFIASTTEGVSLASKSGEPVRKVVLDSENLNSFSNAMQNSALVNDLNSCMGDGSSLDVNSLKESLDMPTVYVEVDKDYNFTRLYFSTSIDNAYGCDCPEGAECDCVATEEPMNMIVDLSFSYPNTIDVAEPTEYVNLMDMIQQIMLTMPVTYDTETEVTEVTE